MLPLLLMAVALLLAGCARAPRTSAAPPPASGLAAPVLAPMAARERLLRDLDKQKAQARERAATLDDAAGRD